MKISAAVAVWLCAVFAAVSFGVAFTGYASLDSIGDAAQRDAALGYIGFWAFLGCVATLSGVLSWMMTRGMFGPVE